MSTKFEDVNVPTVGQPVAHNGLLYDLKKDIVISGISGRLPQSDNIEEFKKNLFEGVDMITENNDRWQPGCFDLPSRYGVIKDISLFDAAFFGVQDELANVMDPQLRMLLEVTYEAIVDAGFNPATLRGTRTGVFVGLIFTESEEFWTRDPKLINEFNYIGGCRAMMANRISYTFDFKGPSCTIDTACSASFYAIHQAVRSIRNGDCDAAIVGGINLLLKPMSSLQFHRLGMSSQEGKCRAFDIEAKGYVRSDAVIGIFLQKMEDARRVYAHVLETRTNVDGFKLEGITFPNGQMQYELMKEVYNKRGVNRADVTYFEAHGTGTKAGDPEEVNSITNIFCQDRNEPLLLGSVKSNMGHPEAASGLCAIAKVIIAMENGVIPPNLYYKTPNPNIPGLFDGRLKVIDKMTPWNGGHVALNSFGFGGANAHIVLRSNPKPKLSPVLENQLPKLVVSSGRTIEAVNYMLDGIREHKQDDEFIALVHDIHSENIPGHVARGFEVLGNPDSREVIDFGGAKRPIWFVFSGLGCQWESMGRQLLQIDAFRHSVERSAEILKPEGINLMDLILHGTNESYENVLNCLVTITAIEVGLLDLLTLLDIHPDGILGYSAGEFACAYADGSFTAEQTILTAYWIGKLMQDSDLPAGAMAAVGLSWEETLKRCPPGVYIACHNVANVVVISGPMELTNNFVKELQSQGIFTKVINSSGYAFHSKYIAPVEAKLLAVLEKIIPNPKQRSAKWISCSIPENERGSPFAQLNSAAYCVNGLLSPVLFHEAAACIPDNAIVIDLSPHCVCQNILCISLSSNVTNIGLQNKNCTDNLKFFLSSIGKLYAVGGQPKISNLYPSVSYPVGRGTPMINSLIKWDHSAKWAVANFNQVDNAAEFLIKVDLSKNTDAFISGHVIDGRILFPATGYISLVWKVFAKLNNMDHEKMPVVFENLRFQQATIIPKEGSVKFLINISIESGRFEISEGTSVAVTGTIRHPRSIAKEQLDLPPFIPKKEPELLDLSTKDIYKELRLRGYNYSGLFQGIKKANNRATAGELHWFNNWISYTDTMLQFRILEYANKELYVPTRLLYISIDPVLHMKLVTELPQEDGSFPIYNYKNINIVKSGGIEIRGISASLAPRRHQTQATPKYERYTFIPYENNQVLAQDPDEIRLHALTVLLQVVCENVLGTKLKIAEATGERSSEILLITHVLEVLNSESVINVVDSQVITKSPENYANVFDQSLVKIVKRDINKVPAGQDLHLVIASDVLTNKYMNVLQNLSASLKNGGFIILEETGTYDKNLVKGAGLTFVATQVNSDRTYVLLKKAEQMREPKIINMTEKNFSWLEEVKDALKTAEAEGDEVLLVNQGEELFGMVGFMNCLRYESGGSKVRYFFIQDKKAPKFSLTLPFYANQLNKQVIANVLKGGQWGSYRHLRLELKNDASSLQVEHAFVNTLVRGDLSSLRWIESPLSFHRPENHPETELCKVYYASLNFKDIMLATGKLSPDALPGNIASRECILGMEFSGRDSKGRRVMGMVDSKGLATTVLADPTSLLEVPDKWTLEEAATIPIAYSTSYYALIVRGRLRPGESVLIHAGSGAVGQASISIALHMGCKIFTTVGTQEKRNFLKKTFPQLNDRNIGNSRDTSFEQLVMTETNGRGVDVVLNSLAEEKLHASVRCLSINGRFLEIGKYDLLNNTPLKISKFANETFHGIIIDSLLSANTPEKRTLLHLINEGIQNGAVRPLPVTVFSEYHVEQAFRYMAAGKHIGKVLLKIRDEEPQKIVPQVAPKTVAAIPRTYMSPDKLYILVGGLGGFGLELANWMISRGANYIVLTSRSGIRTGYQSLCVRRWRESGVNITISTADCTTLAGAEKLIRESSEIALVGGIFNLAVVLNDGLIENLTEENFKTVTLPKIDATKHLDVVSRKLCPYLDYFVVFSSVSCGRGNIGQTNYGLANSAMERLMEQRQSNGLPGLAIQWGPIADVGLISDSYNVNNTEIGGTVSQRISSCLSTLDEFLQQLHPVLSSMVLAEKYKIGEYSSSASLVDTVANILGIKDLSKVNPNSTLSELGVDSLMGTEIKQTLERNYDLILSPQQIRNLIFGKLYELSSNNTNKNESSSNIREIDVKEAVEDELLLQFYLTEVLPTESLVKLETKSSNGPPLFIIHAVEGVVSPFRAFARELDRPAYGFQCVEDTPLDTLMDTAESYVKQMKQIQNKGPYHIAAYSFGTCIAFEMGILLEKIGEEVVLTFIDGSPAFVALHSFIKNAVNIKDKEEILDNYKKGLAYFISLIKRDTNYNQAYNILQSEPTEERSLEKMVEVIGNPRFKSNDLKIAATLLLKKAYAARIYKPSEKFDGKITLIKAEESFIPIAYDYGISEVCKQNVQIEELAGDHKSILVGDNAKKIASLLRV